MTIQRKRSGRTFVRPAVIMCVFSVMMGALLIFSWSETMANSTLLGEAGQDSMKLIYNTIDARGFPRIVSIVSIMNQFGFLVGKLDESNFEVHEDGVRELPITVEQLSGGAMDISVALVIDRSGSMRGKPIEDAKNAASIFVGLMQREDQSAVVSFNHEPRTDCPFTKNIDSLKAAISRIESLGGTAIFDALIHAIYLMNPTLKNRAIILLTDGADKDSYHTFQQALTALIANEVQTFTIGLGLNQNSPEENVLKELASKTGGMYFYSPTSDDLEAIYRAIHKMLHSQYRVTYTTHNPAKDGTLRHVRIDVMVRGNTSSDTASYRAPYEGRFDPIDTVKVEHPSFEVVPNPFTPNDDGFNDYTEFKPGESVPDQWTITILDRSGRLVRQLTQGERAWNGRDEAGQLMLPGTYLYLVFDHDQVIHRGLIQLIR